MAAGGHGPPGGLGRHAPPQPPLAHHARREPCGRLQQGGGGGAAPQDYGRDTGDASSSYEDAAATVEARRLEEARLRNWRSRVYLPGDAHRRSAGAADAGGAVAEVEARALELLEARRQLNLQARTRGGGSLPP